MYRNPNYGFIDTAYGYSDEQIHRTVHAYGYQGSIHHAHMYPTVNRQASAGHQSQGKVNRAQVLCNHWFL